MARGGQGVGAAVLRLEDGRFLSGRGEYLADLQIPGTLEVAFLRSPVAHAVLRGVHVPEPLRGKVFLADDIGFAKPIIATGGAPGFKRSEYPPLARGKVRFVGEMIAMCVGRSRAEAEDIAQACELELEELPALWDLDVALQPGAARVHDGWEDNVFVETRILAGDLAAAKAAAPIAVQQTLRMARHAGVSLETRGVLAQPDRRLSELLVYSSTQFPHVVRTMLAESLGIAESALRVVAPDVGGGFGIKNNFNPEELAVAALALKLQRPLRWVEDRREHLLACPHAREHRYDMTAYADRTGRIAALEATVVVDAGAYSVWPWTASMEAGMSAGIMTGPYDIPIYHGRAVSVCTNKAPLGPYRGVGRSGACFAIETMIDAVARAVGRTPEDVRLENMVPASAMPYRSATGKLYDSGDYPECARRVLAAIDAPGIRHRQTQPEPDGR
ncbi:MAG TPA: xanthine dehydrogenase family protein, partial [Rhodopila sp.]